MNINFYFTFTFFYFFILINFNFNLFPMPLLPRGCEEHENYIQKFKHLAIEKVCAEMGSMTRRRIILGRKIS